MTDRVSELLGASPTGKASTPSAAPAESTRVDELLYGPQDKSGMSGSVFIQSDPKRSAGYGPALGAGFIDDPKVKAAYFAAKRFPNLPPAEALKRYGVGEDGKVFYQADDGSLIYEVPEEWSWSGAGKKFLGGVGDAVASLPGAVTGIVTAPMIATGPVGAATSLGLTGLAGSAGEGVRQTIGNAIAGDPVSMGDIAKTGAIDAATQGLGASWLKAAERHAARDIKKLDPASVAGLKAKAAAAGVDLTPAQLTNLPSLRNQQRALSGMDASADTMEKFYQKQAGQVDSEMGRFLRGMSANDSAEVMGQRVKGAAFDAMEAVAKQRANAAGPIYREAFDKTVGMNPAALPRAEAIMARMPRDVVAKAMGIARIEGIDLGDPKTSFKGMHYLKLALDRKINAGIWEGVAGAEKNALVNLKNELVDAMDDISAKDVAGRSLYKQARDIYAHASPMVESVREGLTGAIAGLKDDKARNAAGMLLDPKKSGPLAMSQAKKLIQSQDPEAWQQVKRAYLEDLWQNASTQFATSNPAMSGAKYAASVRGNPKQWAMLREALDPQELRAFSDLLDVMEATGRGLKGNSETVEKAVTLRNMSREASGVLGAAAALADAPGKALQGELGQWLREVRLGNHAEKVAGIITSPDGMAKLAQLKKLSPNDQRLRVGVAQLFGIGVTSARRGDRVDEPMYPTPTGQGQR